MHGALGADPVQFRRGYSHLDAQDLVLSDDAGPVKGFDLAQVFERERLGLFGNGVPGNCPLQPVKSSASPVFNSLVNPVALGLCGIEKKPGRFGLCSETSSTEEDLGKVQGRDGRLFKTELGNPDRDGQGRVAKSRTQRCLVEPLVAKAGRKLGKLVRLDLDKAPPGLANFCIGCQQDWVVLTAEGKDLVKFYFRKFFGSPGNASDDKNGKAHDDRKKVKKRVKTLHENTLLQETFGSRSPNNVWLLPAPA